MKLDYSGQYSMWVDIEKGLYYLGIANNDQIKMCRVNKVLKLVN